LFVSHSLHYFTICTAAARNLLAIGSKGRWRDALDACGRAVAISPDYAEAHAMRGYAGLKAEDPIAATESLRMACHLRPEVRHALHVSLAMTGSFSFFYLLHLLLLYSFLSLSLSLSLLLYLLQGARGPRAPGGGGGAAEAGPVHLRALQARGLDHPRGACPPRSLARD
jgi:hypothetical protein